MIFASLFQVRSSDLIFELNLAIVLQINYVRITNAWDNPFQVGRSVQ